MVSITIGYIANVVINLLIYILLIAIYTYIVKLETSGCECAKHPNRDFIKFFTIFSLIILPIFTFVPMSSIEENFGSTIAGVLALIKFIYFIAFIVFLFYTLEYTRYLVNEKCKCSNDMRREFIMVGVIIEFVIIMLNLLVAILLPIVFASVSIILKNIDQVENNIEKTIENPYKSAMNVPKKISTATKMIKNIGEKSFEAIKKVSKVKNNS